MREFTHKHPHPAWCRGDCFVEYVIDPDAEIVYADMGVIAEQAHCSEPFEVKRATPADPDDPWWAWPRPKNFAVNLVQLDGWWSEDTPVTPEGPEIVVDAGSITFSVDPTTAARVGAGLIRAARQARQAPTTRGVG